jgi:two-component system, response regulator PdtaR
MTDPDTQGDNRSFLVLIVEDEFFIALELESALIESGYSVLGPATSVKAALDMLAHQRPDGAILDVHLGREVVTPVALKLKAMGVPFFLASASDADDLNWDAELSDAMNLGKPTNLKRLIGAFDNLSR